MWNSLSKNMTKIEIFYKDLLNEIKTELVTLENGGSSEQIFTQKAVEILENSRVTENVEVRYDRKEIEKSFNHQINAYAISDDSETLDLFITLFKNEDTIQKILTPEINSQFKKIENFFKSCILDNYADQVEESSEVFQLAHGLKISEELRKNLVRVNFFVVTNGEFEKQVTCSGRIVDYQVLYRVFDLNELYGKSISNNDYLEIDFSRDGYEVPFIRSLDSNDNSETYLAILPGEAIAKMYDEYGSRLLEQNVRSFLQFTGKINKGIKNTIVNEPEMFLSYNNGISATASELVIDNTTSKGFPRISKIIDFQIVNGGQTTASIYYTKRKHKVDISKILVQVKLSIVKNKDEYPTIVSKIAEYTNTQNKVSTADLSSNKPFHIQFEKLSRTISTPDDKKWFYERVRGQYKNARLKEDVNSSKIKKFDKDYPKDKVFTKEELAKYINSYIEIFKGQKLVVGPHVVIKNINNYTQFINHNTSEKIENDNIYFEDSIAKLILFKSCESSYGRKPNAIGDLRFVTVPYSIAYFGFKTDYKLDLYKIWKNQNISVNLVDFLYELMCLVDKFLCEKSPEALINMWARKEECWKTLKDIEFDLDFSRVKDEMIDPVKSILRKKLNIEEIDNLKRQEVLKENIDRISLITEIGWTKILYWAESSTGLLSIEEQNTVKNIIYKLKFQKPLLGNEIENGLQVLETLDNENPAVLISDSDS